MVGSILWLLSTVIQLFLCAILAYGILTLLWKFWTSAYADIPGPPTYPLVGNILQMETDPAKAATQFQGWVEQYGALYVIWFGPLPVVFCGSPEYADAVLNSQTITEKSTLYSFADWLGDGLVRSHGEKWKKRRRLLNPGFQFSALTKYREMIDAKAKVLLQKLDAYAEGSKVFDIQTPIALTSLDILCEAVMGVNRDAQKAESSDYVKAILDISRITFKRIKMPLLWPDFIFRLTKMGRNYYRLVNIIHDHSRNVILKCLEARSQKKDCQDVDNKITAFMDALLNMHACNEIDIDGIREEVDTFIFAGFDTVSSCISWTLHLLGRHPEIQDKVLQEIDYLTGAGQRTIADVANDLTYLNSVIKESLRMHPPAPIVMRNVTDACYLHGRLLPKGAQLVVNIHRLHHDSKYWLSPEDFLPERFSSKGVDRRRAFQYIPFSAGPRNCIGQRLAMLETKVVLANVVRRFRITSMQRPNEIEECGEFVARSNNGLMLKISRRRLDEKQG